MAPEWDGHCPPIRRRCRWWGYPGQPPRRRWIRRTPKLAVRRWTRRTAKIEPATELKRVSRGGGFNFASVWTRPPCQPARTYEKISGATIVASDSMMYFG